MKNLILLFTLLITSSAFAYRGPAQSSGGSGKTWSAYFEPYLGYEIGTYYATDPPALGTTVYEGNSRAFIGGARLGVTFHNWFLGADASTLSGGTQTYKDSIIPRDIITRDLVAVNLGYSFGRAKVWATSFISNKYGERTDVAATSFTDYSGSGGYGLGIGYKFANHMAFNIEYHNYNIDEVTGTNGGNKGPIAVFYSNFTQKVYIMSLSFPFSK